MNRRLAFGLAIWLCASGVFAAQPVTPVDQLGNATVAAPGASNTPPAAQYLGGKDSTTSTTFDGVTVDNSDGGLHIHIVGGSIANTSFGISGTLPAFAATPTFNLGTLNGAATAANQAVQPVGTAAFATGQVSCGTTATLVVAARTGAVGTGRASLSVKQTGATPIQVELGSSGVTTSTGLVIDPAQGASYNTLSTAAFYCVVATGTQTVSFIENF